MSSLECSEQTKKICIIGLGYVGLPLAVEFSKKYHTVGFDISSSRISELSQYHDRTREVPEHELKSSNLILTNDIKKASDCNFFIVTVPTPIDRYKNPDLSFLVSASAVVGSVLKKNDIVIYESTVYPGCTEEICIPELERVSGLVFNKDFFCGYSPERINPGDKTKRVSDIKKVTSGSNEKAADAVDALYSSIITAGTHKAQSIKIAEAAKVIENTQRDINIALMNELAIIFDRLDVPTKHVLDAASTKWNFLRFEPGLVGGHCIGVDPYYLTFKAQAEGFMPNMILSGRRINDSMGKFVAEKTIKMMIKQGNPIKNSRVLLAGFTFKENCPDIRNTRVIDIFKELEEYGVHIDVFEPVATREDIEKEYNIKAVEKPSGKYDAVIIAVKHTEFYEMFSGASLKNILSYNGTVVDVKGIISEDLPEALAYWRL